MEQSYRLFICGRCRTQVHICRRCDHGNQYCRTCAPLARQDSLLRAGDKYQKTERGRANHAARQQRYLERKMTHHGSAPPGEASPCPSQAAVAETSAMTPEDAHENPTPLYQLTAPAARDDESGRVLCDICGRPCQPFARLDFLATPRRARATVGGPPG